MDTSSVNHTEHYKTLIGVQASPQKVAERLDEIFQTGIIYISCFWLVMKVRANHFEFYRFLKVKYYYLLFLIYVELKCYFPFIGGHIGFDFGYSYFIILKP